MRTHSFIQFVSIRLTENFELNLRIKMNQQYQDHSNILFIEKRHVFNEIDKFRAIWLQLDGNSSCPFKRMLKYVIENYILPELEHDLNYSMPFL